MLTSTQLITPKTIFKTAKEVDGLSFLEAINEKTELITAAAIQMKNGTLIAAVTPWNSANVTLALIVPSAIPLLQASTKASVFGKITKIKAVIKNPKRDYAEKLLKMSSKAVMKWLVEGAKLFIESEYELPKCQAVEDAIKTYKEENNWVEHFLNDCCLLEGKVAGGLLFKIYRQWANEVGEFPRRSRDFAEALKAAGFVSKKTSKENQWIGISINPNRTYAKIDEFL